MTARSAMLMLGLVWLTAASLAGCARGPGNGFGEIAGISLEAAFAPSEARDLGGGWALTDLGYRFRVDQLDVDGGELLLEQLPGAGGGTFDPANPPPGYTLCHGGHCHAEDGSLVDYEDIEAELAGGEGAWTPVAAFAAGDGLDLVGGETRSWDTCEPSCLLGAGHLKRSSLPLGAATLEATVWDDAGGTTEWTLALQSADAGTLHGTLDLPLDRDHDPVLTLALAVAVDGMLLDGLDPEELLPGGGALVLDEAAAAAVWTQLEQTDIGAATVREPF